jgi:hypothetical protein
MSKLVKDLELLIPCRFFFVPTIFFVNFLTYTSISLKWRAYFVDDPDDVSTDSTFPKLHFNLRR